MAKQSYSCNVYTTHCIYWNCTHYCKNVFLNSVKWHLHYRYLIQTSTEPPLKPKKPWHKQCTSEICKDTSAHTHTHTHTHTQRHTQGSFSILLLNQSCVSLMRLSSKHLHWDAMRVWTHRVWFTSPPGMSQLCCYITLAKQIWECLTERTRFVTHKTF